MKRKIVISAVALAVLALVAVGWFGWARHVDEASLPGIVATNGRVEATRIDVATKIAGRVIAVIPHEGDMIDAGSVVARLDPAEIEDELHQSEAQATVTRAALVSSQAAVVNCESELTFAGQEFHRVSALTQDGYATKEMLDQRQQQMSSAQAALAAAKAQVNPASASIVAADANVGRVEVVLGDATITSPIRGRVQYRLVEPGAVLPAGGRILTLLDLTDVYMTIFLSADAAGKLAVGDEARVILDAAPGDVFPTTISFVAAEAQFTPKTVETDSEREKLMFRIRLRAPPAMLKTIGDQVKTGLRGIGYLRVDPKAPWPARLAVKLPP